jgi:hypothetical protein
MRLRHGLLAKGVHLISGFLIFCHDPSKNDRGIWLIVGGNIRHLADVIAVISNASGTGRKNLRPL